MRNRFVFRPDLSNGFTGNEMVIVPNLILLGTVAVIKRDREAMLPFVIKGLKAIFEDPKTPFVKAKVLDYLFDGIGFTCDGDFTAKTLCAGFEAEANQIEVFNETYYKYSILGDVSTTKKYRVKLKYTKKNYAEK
jgi:CD36 family